VGSTSRSTAQGENTMLKLFPLFTMFAVGGGFLIGERLWFLIHERRP